MTFPPLIIWAKALFFFEQLFPVVARTWLRSKSGSLFLGPKFRFWAKKSDFCHTTPILVNGPFVALGEIVHFPPWERFFDFSFQSYGPFRTKKVFPLPTVRALSASSSPSALSEQALRACGLRERAGQECFFSLHIIQKASGAPPPGKYLASTQYRNALNICEPRSQETNI